jgi:hypothetical protein
MLGIVNDGKVLPSSARSGFLSQTLKYASAYDRKTSMGIAEKKSFPCPQQDV